MGRGKPDQTRLGVEERAHEVCFEFVSWGAWGVAVGKISEGMVDAEPLSCHRQLSCYGQMLPACVTVDDRPPPSPFEYSVTGKSFPAYALFLLTFLFPSWTDAAGSVGGLSLHCSEILCVTESTTA